VLPPLAKEAARNERDPDYAITVRVRRARVRAWMVDLVERAGARTRQARVVEMAR
jgi:hypothetical protein